MGCYFFFFFSSRRRHTRLQGDWSSDVCSSDLEHAAMSPRYLGCAVVLVKSFARIQETNLKKQGILPLTFKDPRDYDRFGPQDRVSVTGLATLAPGKPVTVTIRKPDGRTETIESLHSLTDEHITWFKAGSALNAAQGERT